MTDSDRDRNIVAAICYIPFFSIVISIIILFVEKDDRFIRFHALQALLFSIVYFSAVFLLGGLPFLGGIVLGLIFILALFVWIFGIISAFKGKIFKLPYLGKIAEGRVE